MRLLFTGRNTSLLLSSRRSAFYYGDFHLPLPVGEKASQATATVSIWENRFKWLVWLELCNKSFFFRLLSSVQLRENRQDTSFQMQPLVIIWMKHLNMISFGSPAGLVFLFLLQVIALSASGTIALQVMRDLCNCFIDLSPLKTVSTSIIHYQVAELMQSRWERVKKNFWPAIWRTKINVLNTVHFAVVYIYCQGRAAQEVYADIYESLI